MQRNLLRRPEVEQAVRLKRAQLYDLIARGVFPRPIKIGLRHVAWYEDEVLQYLADRTAERDAKPRRAA